MREAVNLKVLQVLVRKWVSKQPFAPGDRCKACAGDKNYHPLLGVVEEVGELAHAHLKGEQGIRHTPEVIQAKKVDAVADIVIYLLDYCEREGISLDDAVYDVWNHVCKRDWTADPTNETGHAQ